MICWKRPWNLSCFQLFLEYRCWNRKYVIRTLWIIKYFRITYCNLKVNSKANNQILHKLWSICIQLHSCHMNIQCRNSKAFHQDNNSFFVLVTNHLADLHLHPQKQHSTGWNWINSIFDLWIYFYLIQIWIKITFLFLEQLQCVCVPELRIDSENIKCVEMIDTKILF